MKYAISAHRLIAKLLSSSNEQLQEYLTVYLVGIFEAIADHLFAETTSTVIQSSLSTLIALTKNVRMPIAPTLPLVDRLMTKDFPVDIMKPIVHLFIVVIDRLRPGTDWYASPTKISRLLKALATSDRELHSLFLRSIEALSTCSAATVQVLVLHGFIDIALEGLSRPSDTAICLQILANFAYLSPNVCDSICSSDCFLDSIDQAIQFGSMDDKTSLVYLLSNIMFRGSLDHVRRLFLPEIVTFMRDVLGTADDDLILVIIEGISQVLIREKEAGLCSLREMIFDSGILEELKIRAGSGIEFEPSLPDLQF